MSIHSAKPAARKGIAHPISISLCITLYNTFPCPLTGNEGGVIFVLPALWLHSSPRKRATRPTRRRKRTESMASRASSGEIAHHREGEKACSERDLRQAHKHQPEYGGKSVQAAGTHPPTDATVPRAPHRTLLGATEQLFDVPLTAKRRHDRRPATCCWRPSTASVTRRPRPRSSDWYGRTILHPGLRNFGTALRRRRSGLPRICPSTWIRGQLATTLSAAPGSTAFAGSVERKADACRRLPSPTIRPTSTLISPATTHATNWRSAGTTNKAVTSCVRSTFSPYPRHAHLGQLTRQGLHRGNVADIRQFSTSAAACPSGNEIRLPDRAGTRPDRQFRS